MGGIFQLFQWLEILIKNLNIVRPWELEAENWPKKETGGELWLKQLATAC